jgi:uncharacterized protein
MRSTTTSQRTYAAGWTRRHRDKTRALDRSTQAKLAAARRIAEVLARQYGVDRVYLLGSLARGTTVHESSDVDIAVEGLAPDRYFEALAELWDLLPPGAELDMVPLEYASAEMLAVVKSEGVMLHGS